MDLYKLMGDKVRDALLRSHSLCEVDYPLAGEERLLPAGGHFLVQGTQHGPLKF